MGADYNNSVFTKPTETQYALMQSGWSIVVLTSIAIIVYETNKCSSRAAAISMGSILSIGSALLFGGSIAFNANDDNILQISSEWALGFSAFIASITTAILLAQNAKLRQDFHHKADGLLNQRLSISV